MGTGTLIKRTQNLLSRKTKTTGKRPGTGTLKKELKINKASRNKAPTTAIQFSGHTKSIAIKTKNGSQSYTLDYIADRQALITRPVQPREQAKRKMFSV